MAIQSQPGPRIVAIRIKPSRRPAWRADVTVEDDDRKRRTRRMEFGRYPRFEDIREAASFGQLVDPPRLRGRVGERAPIEPPRL